MAEEQSKLRSQGGISHAKQPHGTGKLAGGEGGHAINAKSHPIPGKRGHIEHYKQHGHGHHHTGPLKGADTFSHRRPWMGKDGHHTAYGKSPRGGD